MAHASAAPNAEPPRARAQLLAETTTWLRGAENTVALELTPEPGWHTYWINPGDSGLSTKLEWILPKGVMAGAIQWPAPHRAPLGELTNYGYGESTLHLVSITVPADWPANQPLELKAKAKWLVCKDICIPGEADLTLSRPVIDGSADLDGEHAAAFEQARAELPQVVPGLQAHFAVADGALSIAFEGIDLSKAHEVDFFPLAGDLVNHAAPQKFALEPNGLRLTQALSAYYIDAPKRVDGVLAVTDDSGRHAYQISAASGTVVAVKVSTTASVAATPKGSSIDTMPINNPPSFLLALCLALLGGLILNLMPCVFPVLSLKAISLAQSAGSNRANQRVQAFAYTAGAVISCVAAASVLLALRAGGEALGWGFQLQSPAFVAVLAYLMFALGLSMSGVVEIGSGWMGAGSSLADKKGWTGSFFTGVLAVVVASPCTAPFMGSALGYAVTQPPLVALLVFAALGLGLALPFLLIGFFPACVRLLPRPGAWMLTFKQAMAFPLYLTVAWLLWVLTRQAGADALGLAASGLVAVSFALWLYGRPQRGWFTTLLALIALALAGLALVSPMMKAPAPGAAKQALASGHQAWSAATVATLRSQGRSVFVDFTADWCITCKVNERGTLASDKVQAAFAAQQVAVLTADWTTSDPAITKALAEFGRNGVPLYLVYPNGGEPRVLPQVLTPQLVIDALTP